jgi:hypothetical protein
MTHRRIAVKVGKTLSPEMNINVGCVQGSILGPKLFNIYCANIAKAISKNSIIVSYADDSYVLNSNCDLGLLIKETEACFASHVSFMRNIGMVVNETKTELLFSTRLKDIESISIATGPSSRVSSSKCIKALGVKISDDLDWSVHVDYSLQRSRHIIPRIKHLRKWLNSEELLRLITAQYFSIVFYCSPLWMGGLSAASWRRINSAHYRALRAVYGDFKFKMKRSELDKISKRATPVEWASYAIASTVIKLFNLSDCNVAKALRSSAYINDRMPGRGKFIDKSRLKIGRQSIQYRIGPIFSKINFDWIGTSMSEDSLRRSLKKLFFTYFDTNQ